MSTFKWNINITILSFVVIALLAACQTPPTSENLEIALKQEKFTIHILKSRGNIMGVAKRTDARDRFEITTHNQKRKVIFYTDFYPLDSTLTFELKPQETDSLILILRQAVQTHDPNKEYYGCCMCSNTDLEIVTSEMNLEILPSETVEIMLSRLLMKYHNAKYKLEMELDN